MASFQAKEWLKAAYSDLRNIEHILDDSYLTHIVAFHSQQAHEEDKLIKFINNNNKIIFAEELELNENIKKMIL